MTPHEWSAWIAESFGAHIQKPEVNLRAIAERHPDRYQRALAKAALEFFRAMRAPEEAWDETDRFIAQVNTLDDTHENH